MKTIAVLCEEKEYLERLTSALLKVLPGGYGADGYPDIASFADREEPGRVKAVLLSDGCGTAEERTVLSEHMAIRRIPVWRLTPEASLSEEERCLFMYQPVDRMIDRLAEIFEFSHAGEASKEETAPSPSAEPGNTSARVAAALGWENTWLTSPSSTTAPFSRHILEKFIETSS